MVSLSPIPDIVYEFPDILGDMCTFSPVTYQSPVSQVPVPATAHVASPSLTHVSQEIVLSEGPAHATTHVADLNAPVSSAPTPRSDEQRDPPPTVEDFFKYTKTQEPDHVAEPDISRVHVATPKRDSGNRKQSSLVVQGTQIRHSCNKCPKTFPTNGGLKRHLHTHKTPEANIIPTANTKTGLPRDQVSTEIRSSKRFTCPFCSRSFCAKQGLQVHLVTETCRRADRFLRRVTEGWECTSCDKSFNSRNQAELHTKSHKSGPGLSCPVCRDDYTCSKGNVLVNHVKDKHPQYFVDLGC